MPRACPSYSCRRASRGDACRRMRPLYPSRRELRPFSEGGRTKSSVSRHDIGPQRFKLFRLEEVAPWRHLVLAARHRVNEAFALVGRKFPQIECPAGILHARTVTRRAVDGVELGAARDLDLGEALRL